MSDSTLAGKDFWMVLCTVSIDTVRTGRYARAAWRWARLLAPRRPEPGLRVFYGHDRIPGPGDLVAGGTAKFQRLGSRFPNRPTDFTLLYLGSTWLPRDLQPLLRLARRRRIPVVVNQSGVAYPGWAGDATDEINAEFRRALLAADHVLYQSEFCKQSADRFLGDPQGSWEVLYNAVDIEHFKPAAAPPPAGPILLLAGDQTQAYRLELAVRTLAEVVRSHPDARLLVTGRLVSTPKPLVAELGLEGKVEFLGGYAQRTAPDIYRRAHLLVHTKVKDPCPSAVIEAMGCGLPVVCPASGGTLELVGDEAGVAVPHPNGWERDEPPSPQALAEAVRRVLDELERYRAAARRRAAERFALEPWLTRHAALFAELTAAGPPPPASRTR
jgi:glycosyltransferase involved in cell wall biosynthesis